MKTVESCLSALELDQLPDPATLKQSFRRVLLAVHPDRNPDNRTWAEARTREVIQAYQYLADEVERPATIIQSSSQASASGIERFQVLILGDLCVAMPLKWLRAVVRFEEVIQKRGFHGSMIVHNNRMYPLLSYRGRSATGRPGQTMVLFEWLNGRSAMVLPDAVDHFYTQDLDYRELIWSRRSDGSVRIIHDGRSLVFPAFLIPLMEQERRMEVPGSNDQR
jgi:hypothetical protein